MSIHEVIRAGRKRLGLSVEEFAEKVEVSRGAVQQWEKEGGTAPTRKNQPKVAQLLGITVAELMGETSNVALGPENRGDVPLISWVQAGNWAEAVDTLQPGEAERWLPCPVPHGTKSYALRVQGDSMTSPHGRSYPEGCIVFVDPEKCSPNNGARVIAKLEGTDHVTFKLYKEEDGRRWLQPLNPAHQPIREPFRVIGTVIGKWEDE